MKSIKSSVRLLIAVCTLLPCNQKLSGMATTLSLAALATNLCAYECYRAYKNRYPDVGIASETLVRGIGTRIPIGQIKPGDRVIGINENETTRNGVAINTSKKNVSRLIQITIEEESILVAPGQLFCSCENGWVQARNLELGDSLHGLEGPVVIDDVETIDIEAVVCTIAMDDELGRFCISSHNILTYNFSSEMLWRPASRVACSAGCLVKSAAELVAQLWMQKMTEDWVNKHFPPS